MGAPQPPQVVIPLIDGRFLAISPDGIRDDQRFFALTTLMSVERLGTVPETLAFEVQKLGQIVFQLARPGDADVALDALYRLRPELRPATPATATPATATPVTATPVTATPAPTTPDSASGPDVNSGAAGTSTALEATPGATPDATPGAASTSPLGTTEATPSAPPQAPAASGWDATPPAPPVAAYPPYPPYPTYPGYVPSPGAPMPPAGAPGYPPNLPYPPYAPGFPPPGASYPPYGAYPYGPPIAVPGAPVSGLPPYPRSFGDLLGAIFSQYGKYFWPLIRLALVAVLLPEVIVGLAQVGIYLFVGANPLAPALDTTSQLFTQLGVNVPPTGPTLPLAKLNLYSELNLVIVLVGLLAGAWEVALMAQGAREAVLGRPVRLGAALRAGLRRILPTLGITLLVALISFTALLPGLIALGLTVATGSAGAAFLSFMLLSAGFVFVIFLAIRLAMAPYIAALGLGRAISRSWELTRGHWWRTFGAIFVIGILVNVVVGLLADVQVVSFLVGVAIVSPLVLTLATPLLTLTYTTLLYDLRLRHDGYPTVIREG